ncbi:MAG: hypothetical protein ABF979_16005 [Gluconobacter sp.]|uniref:hypothetical protein n=1 Tax=Gluconobacter sp. TaxID=1876758 RepID=UPI0039EA49C1
MAKVPHNKIDWTPLLPSVLALMKKGLTAQKMGEALGVSATALMSAIERHAPAKLRSEWKKGFRKAGHTKPAPILRGPLEAGSSVTWSALWNGPVPAFPEDFKRSRLS